MKHEDPHKPPEIHSHHAGAVQALIRGDCPEHLQQDFMGWLINDVCGTYDLSYRPGSQRATDFAEGKRFVGLQLVLASKLDPAKLKTLAEEK